MRSCVACVDVLWFLCASPCAVHVLILCCACAALALVCMAPTSSAATQRRPGPGGFDTAVHLGRESTGRVSSQTNYASPDYIECAVAGFTNCTELTRSNRSKAQTNRTKEQVARHNAKMAAKNNPQRPVVRKVQYRQ